jgi:hypothetical protein
MSHSTFLIVCAVLIVIPFVVSCIKGNPIIGLVCGFASLMIMGFAAEHGASMFQIHLVGVLIAGLGTTWSLHGD